MSHTYPVRRIADGGRPEGPGLWLDLIKATNRIAPESFGQPTALSRNGAGEYTEEYPAFLVTFHSNGTVTVSGNTPEADALLDTAAANVVATTNAKEK